MTQSVEQETKHEAASSPAIKDVRPRPRGALQRSTQMWLMMGLAAMLLAIITLTGNRSPEEREQPERPSTGQIDAERVAAFQAQLRQRQQDLEREQPETPVVSTQRIEGGSSESDTADPLEDERRRREYESLFASAVAFTRNPADPSKVAQASPSAAMGERSGASRLDGLDAQAQASLRRLDVALAQLQQPDSAATTEPKDTPNGGAMRDSDGKPPAATGPVLPGTATHLLMEGSIVDTVLRTRIDGEAAGPVVCLVTHDVWSFNGDAVVIPRGTKVLGATKAMDTLGERLMAITFHRLIYPNGATRALQDFQGLDQAGAMGLRSKTEPNALASIGGAAAVGLVSGLSQAVSTGGLTGTRGDRTVVIVGDGANATGQATARIVDRLLNRRRPTPEGTRVKLYVTRDLELPAYESKASDRQTWR